MSCEGERRGHEGNGDDDTALIASTIASSVACLCVPGVEGVIHSTQRLAPLHRVRKQQAQYQKEYLTV